MRRFLVFLTGLIVIVSSLALVACGGGDNGDDGGSSSSDSTVVNIMMTDIGDSYTMVPDKSSVPAGSVKFVAVNEGLLEHELLVLKLDNMDVDLASLIVDGALPEGEGSEAETIPGAGAIIGEIEPEDLQPDQTNNVTFDLAAGDYVLLCNIETHYQLGMWTMFTVT